MRKLQQKAEVLENNKGKRNIKKRIITMILCGALAVGAWTQIPTVSADSITPVLSIGFASGNGTRTSPYVIATPKQLQYLSRMVEEGKSGEGIYFQTVKNIDMEHFSIKPIGTEERPFQGVFEGSGLTISHLKIETQEEDNVGLFGVTSESAIIQNVIVKESTIVGRQRVGTIVGNNKGALRDCFAEGDVFAQSSVGGIAGENSGIVDRSAFIGNLQTLEHWIPASNNNVEKDLPSNTEQVNPPQDPAEDNSEIDQLLPEENTEKNETAKPIQPEATQPEATQPETTQPGSSQTETTQSNPSQPAASPTDKKELFLEGTANTISDEMSSEIQKENIVPLIGMKENAKDAVIEGMSTSYFKQGDEFYWSSWETDQTQLKSKEEQAKVGTQEIQKDQNSPQNTAPSEETKGSATQQQEEMQPLSDRESGTLEQPSKQGLANVTEDTSSTASKETSGEESKETSGTVPEQIQPEQEQPEQEQPEQIQPEQVQPEQVQPEQEQPEQEQPEQEQPEQEQPEQIQPDHEQEDENNGTGESKAFGGLVGVNYGDITRSFVIGKILGGQTVGGLVGKSAADATITFCYSAAEVEGMETYTGTIGKNDGLAEYVYYDKELFIDTNGKTVGEGIDTATMQSQDFVYQINDEVRKFLESQGIGEREDNPPAEDTNATEGKDEESSEEEGEQESGGSQEETYDAEDELTGEDSNGETSEGPEDEQDDSSDESSDGDSEQETGDTDGGFFESSSEGDSWQPTSAPLKENQELYYKMDSWKVEEIIAKPILDLELHDFEPFYIEEFGEYPTLHFKWRDGISIPNLPDWKVMDSWTIEASPPTRGTGAMDDPYQITNGAELAWISGLCLDGADTKGIHVVLANSIDLSGNQWAPIGTDANPFRGVFEGQDTEITGLFIKEEGLDYAGLFGFVGEEGVIRNVNVSGEVTGKQYVAGIAAVNQGKITGCQNNAMITSAQTSGGISSYNAGVIEYSANYGTIHAEAVSAGITGENPGMVLSSFNRGPVTATHYAGGLIGRQQSTGVARKSYNAAPVSQGSDNGPAIGDNKGKISDIYYSTNFETKETAAVIGVGKTVDEMKDTNFLEILNQEYPLS